MKKFTLPLAVAFAAVFSVSTVNAAIDDAGMRYVSASEGFGGSLRVNLLKDTNEKLKGVYSTLGSTRLYVIGDVDLGGGLSSTYYWEWRTSDDKKIETDSVHAGLKGPFGEIRAGIVEPVASAFIPSDDVTNDVGVGSKNLFGTSPNVIRWVSPEINGFLVGAAVQMKDNVGDDDAIDAFDLAIVYKLPQGLSVGAGYEDVSVNKSSQSGFRVGAQYGQDNWLIAYNYRDYNNFGRKVEDGYLLNVLTGFAIGTVPEAITALEEAGITDDEIKAIAAAFLAEGKVINYHYAGSTTTEQQTQDLKEINTIFTDADVLDSYFKGVDYSAHTMSGKIDVDKFTFSAGYQKEEVEYSGRSVVVTTEVVHNSKTLIPADAPAITKGRKVTADTITFDVAYHLGSKSKLIAAYKTVDLQNAKDSKNTTYLLYRVDF